MSRRNTIGCMALAAALMLGVPGCDKGKNATTTTKAPAGAPRR